MNAKRSSTRKRQPKLLWPNDPRWDIRIGIPNSKLVQLLVTHNTDAPGSAADWDGAPHE